MTPHPYYHDSYMTLYSGDAVDVLVDLPDASVHCVVTSPPYWGLRDYGTGTWLGGAPRCPHTISSGTGARSLHSAGNDLAALPDGTGVGRVCRRCGALREDGQYGLEPTPHTYVDTIRAVATQVRRVLVSTGTLWLNLGDCYAAAPPGRTADPMRGSTLSGTASAAARRESVRSAGVDRTRGLVPKNLVGMPWRVAFALQADGWILRNAIVWHKPNAMPESVRDRVSTRYELLFLFAQQRSYWFDLDAIRVPFVRPQASSERAVIGDRVGRNASRDGRARRRGCTVDGADRDLSGSLRSRPGSNVRPTGQRRDTRHPRGKNPGDVWTLPTRPLRDAHHAAFPVDIPLRCIAAGCPPDGVVLDPFSGAGTTGMAARQLGRRYIGVDLNPRFHDIGLRRMHAHNDTAAKAGADSGDRGTEADQR